MNEGISFPLISRISISAKVTGNYRTSFVQRLVAYAVEVWQLFLMAEQTATRMTKKDSNSETKKVLQWIGKRLNLQNEAKKDIGN